ncbi:MAG TPA: DegT/DnrJ/EryC1/StrS family aminotransferase [Thermoanaerobaculia bacterium]|jgi:dTDP-4-amino-4,6-dideoxygalactose transaminase|nr:DegT/DnrJ/EryC1/StrS family aminotransferase [Thermoanaerobaculia bacterium]
MIALYRPPAAPDLAESLQQVVASGWWGNGPSCGLLEQYFVERHEGAAVALNSGTAALFAAGRLLKPAPGDEVIVPAITYLSTAIAFHEAGFAVKVADVDPSTLLITEELVTPLLTEKTRAIVAVHLYGQRIDMTGLQSLCRRHRLALIEDRAHRIGLGDPPSGDYACYSFNVMKEAPSADGGLLWCKDAQQIETARLLSNVGVASETWGRTQGSIHGSYGFANASGLRLRMSDVASTFVLSGLRYAENWREKRRSIFAAYADACENLSPFVEMRTSSIEDSFLMAICRVPAAGRESVRERFQRAGVSTSTMHYPALSGHPLFPGAFCPHAEAAAAELVTIPLYPDLTDECVSRVVDALKSLVPVLGGGSV